MQIQFSTQTQGELPRGNLLQAVQKALQATMTQAKGTAAEAIEARYISAHLGTRKLKVKVSGLKATLSSRGARNPLPKFKIAPRKRLKPQPKSGVFAQVLKSSGGEYLKNAFFAKKVIFERVGKPRLPIRKLFSVSAPGMLKADPVISKVIKGLEKEFAKNLADSL